MPWLNTLHGSKPKYPGTNADDIANGTRGTGGDASRLAAPLLVVVVALACAWPLFRYGYPSNTDDVYYHVTYAGQFLHEILRGTLYPRWLAGMNGGLGAPAFFFYGPFPYWITSLIGLLTGVRDGLTLLGVAAVFLLVMSGLAAYFWLRALVARWPAAIGAALYVALPYHLTIDLWTRSAFAEFTAYLWLPLLFLSIEKMRACRATGVLLFAPVFALLVATHIITAMLVSGCALAYMLCRFSRVIAYAYAAAGFALGAALAAAYLGPALGLRGEVFIPIGDLPSHEFMLSGQRPPGRQGLWQALTFLVVAELSCVTILLMATAYLLRGTERRLVLIWGFLTLFALLGTTIMFAPIWRALPVLRNAQFPFRLNTIADLGFATLIALLSARLLARARRPDRFALIGLAALAVAGAAQAALPIARGNFERNAIHMSKPVMVAAQGDFLMFRPLPSLYRLPADQSPPSAAVIPRAQVVAGNATVDQVREMPRRFDIVINASGPATLQLGQLWFAGWRASAEGVPLPVRPSAEMGLVDIDVPSGRHEVTIELGRGPLENVGRIISGIAALTWLGLVLFTWKRHRAEPVASTC